MVRRIIKLAVIIVVILSVILTANLTYASDNCHFKYSKATLEKASPLLLMQLSQKSPIDTQRIFIHTYQLLTKYQLTKLSRRGIHVYVESWIPPVGAHSLGFYIATMPVNRINSLAALSFIIRINTAERVLFPTVEEGGLNNGF